MSQLLLWDGSLRNEFLSFRSIGELLESFLFIGKRDNWGEVEELVRYLALASELSITIPALFSVDAKLCNVALFGSTPRVREKSLE